MNEELTNEVLEAMTKCEYPYCGRCELPAEKFCKTIKKEIKKLATALLEERAKPKVWDGAPEWSTIGRVCWTGKKHGEAYSKLYHRELPKTRTRIMAEEIASAHISNKSDLVDIIEQTITAHMKELEENE